jgi:hypothetical protein
MRLRPTETATLPITLPYRFDTSRVVQTILRGVASLLLVVIAGMLYSLLVRGDRVAALQLLVVTLILVYFGRLFLKNLPTSRGTIDERQVVVEPGVLFGLPLCGPSGRFPVQSFQAVLVERIPPPLFAEGGPHERVVLTGQPGTPDVLVARTADGAGLTLGRGLAAALGLAYKEEDAPY